ncbi:hypothetical protein D9M68_711250 [compost metagenome]
MGKEVAGNPGGHANREVTSGGLAYGILEIRAKGVIVADEAAPVAPVARHQSLAAVVEQVQHIGAGGRVELFQAAVELVAQQVIIRCVQ